jgi:hypothetical protein
MTVKHYKAALAVFTAFVILEAIVFVKATHDIRAKVAEQEHFINLQQLQIHTLANALIPKYYHK